MKFKAGDKIRIKRELDSGKCYGKYNYIYDMKKYINNEAIITKICENNSFLIDLDNGQFRWTNEMVDDIKILKYKKGRKLSMNEVLDFMDGAKIILDTESSKNEVVTKSGLDLIAVDYDGRYEITEGLWKMFNRQAYEYIETSISEVKVTVDQTEIEKYKELTKYLLREIAVLDIERYITIEQFFTALRPDLLKLIKIADK